MDSRDYCTNYEKYGSTNLVIGTFSTLILEDPDFMYMHILIPTVRRFKRDT